MIRIKVACAVAILLFAAPGIARQEKIWVCHVGNEVGPGGEVYLDDPDCVPSAANGYFCPDAGKIDLISVPAHANHLGNPSHEWNGISDYDPIAMGASGEGTQDSDGNGVDDGCQTAQTCPCWSEAEIAALRYPVAGDDSSCSSGDAGIALGDGWRVRGDYVGESSVGTNAFPFVPQYTCGIRDTCDDGNCLDLLRGDNDLSLDEYLACTASLIAAAQDRGFDCWD